MVYYFIIHILSMVGIHQHGRTEEREEQELKELKADEKKLQVKLQHSVRPPSPGVSGRIASTHESPTI
jgi:hypothetical protein